MDLTRQLVIARINPRAKGSIGAGLTRDDLETTLWLPPDDLESLGIEDGAPLEVRVVVDRHDPSTARDPATVQLRVGAAPEEMLQNGVVLLAAGKVSARLLRADTEGSGTPTFKGISVRLQASTSNWSKRDRQGGTAPQAAEAPVQVGGANGASTQRIEDAVCTACGCICDDIQLSISSKSINEAANACEIGRSWFVEDSRQLAQASEDRDVCWIEGRPVELQEGVVRAAEILLAARNPLVYGLSETTCETQRAAVDLADALRANLDTTTSTFHGPTVMGLQSVGESTCTLGEIRDRADLIMLWGVNPLETDPRHYTRYSLMPAGRFVPRGRADRYCVVVDVRKTPTTEFADLPIVLRPGSDFEALWTLRALAAGEAVDAAAVLQATGVKLAAWQTLYEKMRTARYGVILYGTGVTQTPGKHLNCEALLTLVCEMNRHTRFACKAMRGPGNVTGGDNVLTWRTGYPFGVSFGRGFPRYGPGEFTAADLLARGEVDAALIVASDPSSSLGAVAMRNLRRMPRVVVDFRSTTERQQATVAFRTAAYGLNGGGTVYRMDEIPLSLRPALASSLPSDREILERLSAEIVARGGDSAAANVAESQEFQPR